MNDMIELIGLLPSTAHFRFFIIGTFPVAFRSMSTFFCNKTKQNIRVKSSFGKTILFQILFVDVDCLSAAVSMDESLSIDISFLSSPGSSIVQ